VSLSTQRDAQGVGYNSQENPREQVYLKITRTNLIDNSTYFSWESGRP
jgi:hypothetical protein